jgi:beta-N-acetylhexosaminidase
VLVPSVDRVPATLSPRILGRLRSEYDGMVITDALEMGAIGDIEEGAVQALLAGADALCLGHDVDEELTLRVLRAIEARVPAERLHEAATRVRRVAGWVASRPPAEPVDRSVGLEAARRALRAEGDVALRGPANVVELAAAPNVAAGKPSHSLADVLGSDPDGDRVFVVRDAHRHAWMQAEADREDAVVVEIGWPVWRPRRARGWVATYGGSRVSYEAVAELLRPRVPA